MAKTKRFFFEIDEWNSSLFSVQAHVASIYGHLDELRRQGWIVIGMFLPYKLIQAIENYRSYLGEGQVGDYVAENQLFGVELFVHHQNDLCMLCQPRQN